MTPADFCIPECISQSDMPLLAALEAPEDSVLAVISGTEGPAYRPVGAAMVVRDGRIVSGSLSSGCVEGDVVHHATEALQQGRGRTVRYGAGSPYMDIRLPCGGGLDVTLIPSPPRSKLMRLCGNLAQRRHADVVIERTEGLLSLPEAPFSSNDTLSLRILPDIDFHVFGKGPEALTFSAMTHAAGFATRLYTFDEETLAQSGVSTSRLLAGSVPDSFVPDRRSAVVLFFHDHDWEPLILEAAVKTDAFYIGAQGSLRTREARDQALLSMELPEAQIARMRGPIGLVRSMRDPRALAISVLAEVLGVAGDDARAFSAEVPFGQ